MSKNTRLAILWRERATYNFPRLTPIDEVDYFQTIGPEGIGHVCIVMPPAVGFDVGVRGKHVPIC